MSDVHQSRSPHSVPVGFHLSPLHPRLMYLLLLLRSPVQHAMAQQGSLFRARDVEDCQLSVDWGVNCARLTWFFAGHQWSWWFTFIPCLPALVRVIIITVVVPASLSTSRPAYASATATCAGTTAIRCSACGFLAHFGPLCHLQTLAVRGVFVPVDFGHWDSLSVLLLEVGNKFPHLVSTPTSFHKSFLQGSRKTVVNKESCKGFGCCDMGWTCWQVQMYLLLHAFRCLRSLHLFGVTLIRRVLQHHLPVCSSRIRLRVALSSSSSHC